MIKRDVGKWGSKEREGNKTRKGKEINERREEGKERLGPLLCTLWLWDAKQHGEGTEILEEQTGQDKAGHVRSRTDTEAAMEGGSQCVAVAGANAAVGEFLSASLLVARGTLKIQ
jgi:hypothetical protein